MTKTPRWFLMGHELSSESSVCIFGNIFTSNSKSDTHASSRTVACRRGMYGVQNVDMSYPGLSTEVMTHLFYCVP